MNNTCVCVQLYQQHKDASARAHTDLLLTKPCKIALYKILPVIGSDMLYIYDGGGGGYVVVDPNDISVRVRIVAFDVALMF